MFALPPLLGAELVELLLRHGWRVAQRRGGLVVMQNGADSLVIPESTMLGPHVIGALLRTAGICPEAVLDLPRHERPAAL